MQGVLHSIAMAAYRRDDIERVRAATDLVELLTEVTKVKRSGRSRPSPSVSSHA